MWRTQPMTESVRERTKEAFRQCFEDSGGRETFVITQCELSFAWKLSLKSASSWRFQIQDSTVMIVSIVNGRALLPSSFSACLCNLRKWMNEWISDTETTEVFFVSAKWNRVLMRKTLQCFLSSFYSQKKNVLIKSTSQKKFCSNVHSVSRKSNDKARQTFAE